MDQSKEEFLKQFGGDYGYPDAPRGVDEMRAAEFKRLEGMVYLDHAGATLYSEAQMADVVKDLTSSVYGNPHSQSDSSIATSDLVTAARHQVLKYFNASPRDYKCIFTSGATAALKLVGECFPWSRESCYMYTMENHNSVLGIREYPAIKMLMLKMMLILKRTMEVIVCLRYRDTQTKEEVKMCFRTIVRMEAFQPFQSLLVC